MIKDFFVEEKRWIEVAKIFIEGNSHENNEKIERFELALEEKKTHKKKSAKAEKKE